MRSQGSHVWLVGLLLLPVCVQVCLSACRAKGSPEGSSASLVKVALPSVDTATALHPLFDARIHGVSFSAPPKPVEGEVFKRMADVGAEWVAIVPYAYGPGADGRLFMQGATWQWWGESQEGARAQVRMAKAAGLKVMLKPHLWLEHGAFTGTYVPADSLEWLPLEASYRDLILLYAQLAEEERVELLCIGTELKAFVLARPAFWNTLIAEVRSVFAGAITYAANWDEVMHLPFWPALDVIGVDGYFPLTPHHSPTVQEIEAGWQHHVSALEGLSMRMGRKVLFTEIGYRCVANCTVEPWKEDHTAPRDEGAQADAYTAFFNTWHCQPWYAGCFVWKWFADEGVREERRGNGYSPQRTAALHVIREAFNGR